MADIDVVKPLGQPLSAEALDKRKIVTKRQFELILGKSDRRLKAFLQATVGRTGKRYR